MSDCKESSLGKIDKKSLISLEVAILSIVLAISITGTWIRMELGLKDNTNDITTLANKVDSNYEKTSQELVKINTILTKMLTAQEVQNGINIYKLRDRWTAGMMETHDDVWLSILQEYHPELRHEDVPDVPAIQRRYGFGDVGGRLDE